MKVQDLINRCEQKDRLNQITINNNFFRNKNNEDWKLILNNFWFQEVKSYYFYSQYSLYINV